MSRHWTRKPWQPESPLSPWDVPWQRHNDEVDLCYENVSRHFLVRARISKENVKNVREILAVMEGILSLPDHRNVFAWPALLNTWHGVDQADPT